MPWNADAREVGSGAKAFEYVARYDSGAPWRLRGVAPAHMGCLSHLRSLVSAVQKTAMDADRITAVEEDSVRFRWTGRQSSNERITRLSGEEFLRRFLQHVLPRGFMRVRHFGWLSPEAQHVLPACAICCGPGSPSSKTLTRWKFVVPPAGAS